MNGHINNLLEEAIGFYNFSTPKADFIRHNENITYSIEDGNKKYLLRIHTEAAGLDFSFYRGDFSREILIASEIDLLNGLLVKSDINVQHPIKNKNGYYLSRLKNGLIVTVLSWLDGETLSDIELTKELVYKIGQMTAKLHQASHLLPHLSRCCYNDLFAEKFIKETKVANELNHIGINPRNKFEIIIDKLKKILLKEKDNFTIIHLDLSKTNMIYNGDTVSPIDFSMFGYGIPEMDLGDLAFMIGDNQLIFSLLTGYESVGIHKINQSYLDICKAFSVIQYVIIHHNQLHVDLKFQNKIDNWCSTIFEPLITQIQK